MTEILYMDERETAKFTRLSAKTLQRKRLDGSGPAFIKCGARVLYNRGDVTSWLEKQKIQSTSGYVGG